ncbi:hypothetical protein [Flavonifractor phage Castelnaud]|nr:hypothetical protein [Flavonifractor phage Castelnaud]
MPGPRGAYRSGSLLQFSFPDLTSRVSSLIPLPYAVIIKVAGVRLPAHLGVCGAVGFGLSAAPLFTHS